MGRGLWSGCTSVLKVQGPILAGNKHILNCINFVFISLKNAQIKIKIKIKKH